LEILEDTIADPVLIEPETIETLDNDTQLISHIVSEQDNTQPNIDNYVQQIQSKYRKIHRRRKIDHSPISKVPSSYNAVKNSSMTNNASTHDTMAESIFLTSSLMPDISTKGSNNVKDNESNFEQVYLAPESKSSIELFFDSMAQTVKKLPPKAQADIKMNICKIVTEAEIRYSGQNVPQSTQQFIAPPGMIPKLVLIPCDMIDNQNSKD